MNLRTYRTFQALVLAGLGIFLLARLFDGRILLYINQRFTFLVLAGAVGLLLIAQVVMRSRPAAAEDDDHAHDGDLHDEHDHAEHTRTGFGVWILALPLLIGLLVPPRALGTTEIATRGINASAPLTARSGEETLSVELASTQRTVLDWIRAFNYANEPRLFEGEAADVTGFVYHDERLEAGQFMVGRFSLTCCVADAVATGMVVNWPEAAGLVDNQWVRVRGVIEVAEFDEKTVPLIRAASVENVPTPVQPYLFP